MTDLERLAAQIAEKIRSVYFEQIPADELTKLLLAFAAEIKRSAKP